MLGPGRPFDREVPLPPGNQCGRRCRVDRGIRGEATSRQGDGEESRSYEPHLEVVVTVCSKVFLAQWLREACAECGFLRPRSEERRVGKECRCRWAPEQ